MLNTKYFTKVHQRTEKNVIYTGYRPKYSPMVLVSEKDGTPLASLHLLCQDYENQNDDLQNRGRSLVTQRPLTMNDNCHFQGLVNKEDQEIEFVMTNLSGLGNINFNILKNDTDRLNKINIVRPNQDVVVKSDKDSEKSLVLKSIKKSDGSTLTLEEDESSSSKNKGSYYHISIIPQSDKKELCDLYEKTKWITSDILVFKKPQPVYNSNSYLSMPYSITLGDTRSGEVLLGDIHPHESNIAYPAVAAIGRIDPFFSEICYDSVPVSTTTLNSGMRSLEIFCDSVPVSTTTPNSGHIETCVYTEEDEEENEGFSLFDQVDRSKGMNQNILTSNAAKIEDGRNVVVESMSSSLQFNYERQAENVILGISVQESLEFFPEPDMKTLKEAVNEEINEILDLEKQRLLNKINVIYESITCAICMEDNPDQVLYSCGHQCMHKTCCNEKVKKCPLCRKFITAKINVVINSPLEDVKEEVVEENKLNQEEVESDMVLIS
jgi:hypothetical protein